MGPEKSALQAHSHLAAVFFADSLETFTVCFTNVAFLLIVVSKRVFRANVMGIQTPVIEVHGIAHLSAAVLSVVVRYGPVIGDHRQIIRINQLSFAIFFPKGLLFFLNRRGELVGLHHLRGDVVAVEDVLLAVPQHVE